MLESRWPPSFLTVVILIFAEVAPKTIAAVQPERVAYTASFILLPLLKAMYPLVASINWVANGLLEAVRLFDQRWRV